MYYQIVNEISKRTKIINMTSIIVHLLDRFIYFLRSIKRLEKDLDFNKVLLFNYVKFLQGKLTEIKTFYGKKYGKYTKKKKFKGIHRL